MFSLQFIYDTLKAWKHYTISSDPTLKSELKYSIYSFLLTYPEFSSKDLEIIEKLKKRINQHGNQSFLKKIELAVHRLVFSKKPQLQQSSFVNLPIALKHIILSNLSKKERNNILRTCKQSALLLNTSEYWSVAFNEGLLRISTKSYVYLVDKCHGFITHSNFIMLKKPDKYFLTNKFLKKMILSCPYLQQIDLFFIGFQNVRMEYLSSCENLRALSINSNQAKTLAPLQFCTRLSELSIGSLSFAFNRLSSLSVCTTLEILDLHQLYLDDRDMAFATSLTRLKSLNLSSNSVGYRGLSYLSSCQLLEKLDLSYSQIENIELTALVHLHSLKTLILNNTHMVDGLLEILKKFPSLSHLNIAGTQITSIGLKSIDQLVHLESLNVLNTKVDNRIVSFIYKCPQLLSIELSSTHVSNKHKKAIYRWLERKKLGDLNERGQKIRRLNPPIP